MTEAELLKHLLVEVSRLGARVFRNTVGVGRHEDGRVVVYGLCPGSSDLIGWTPLTVTADMVGRTLAVFTAIEAKSARGRASAEQINFLKAVDGSGGIAILARSTDDVRRGLDAHRIRTRT